MISNLISHSVFHSLRLKDGAITPSFYSLKRLQVTLLELLVVIAIIGSMAGVVGVSIQRAIREQRFKTELSQFLDTLRLAQDLMLILDADLHVKIRKSETADALEYWIESDHPLSKNWEKEIKRPPKILKTIQTVRFPEVTKGVIDLKFLSNGMIMSRGPLEVSTSSKENDASAHYRVINLSGYPEPIEPSLIRQDIFPQDNQKADYEEKLTKWIVQEIQLIENPPDLSLPDSEQTSPPAGNNGVLPQD